MASNATVFALVLTGLLVAAEVSSHLWFAREGDADTGAALLTFALPVDEVAGMERLDLSATRGGKALGYDYGELVRLFEPDSESWSMDAYYLEYGPENGRQLKDLFDHSPEVCLRASGSELEQTLPHFVGEVEGRKVVARHLVFSHPLGEQTFHVFKVVWLAGMEPLGLSGTDTDFRKVRLKAAWAGRSRPAARLILVSISGIENASAARALFESEILARCSFR